MAPYNESVTLGEAIDNALQDVKTRWTGDHSGPADPEVFLTREFERMILTLNHDRRQYHHLWVQVVARNPQYNETYGYVLRKNHARGYDPEPYSST